MTDAAGADIKEMANLSYAEAYGENRFKEFARLTGIRKPVSAATLDSCSAEKSMI